MVGSKERSVAAMRGKGKREPHNHKPNRTELNYKGIVLSRSSKRNEKETAHQLGPVLNVEKEGQRGCSSCVGQSRGGTRPSSSTIRILKKNEQEEKIKTALEGHMEEKKVGSCSHRFSLEMGEKRNV